jgi:hypothetical protein
MKASEHEYDVALSFAGEDRAYVEQVADHLLAADIRVFYDAFRQVDLWGKDLYSHLDEIYRLKARYCVMFISRHYRDKLWTNHERESAQARAFQENEEYILPARFDDTEIPGVRPTTGYILLRNLSPAEFAALVLQKIDVTLSKPQLGNRGTFRTPRIPRKDFNPYDEAIGLIRFVGDEIQQRCGALADRGVSCSRFVRDGRTCIRVVASGVTRYSLDVWMGGISGDASLAFSYSRGEISHFTGGMNAWGDVIWSQEFDEPVLNLHNFSLVGHIGHEEAYRYSEFIDALWNEICNVLEAHY